MSKAQAEVKKILQLNETQRENINEELDQKMSILFKKS